MINPILISFLLSFTFTTLVPYTSKHHKCLNVKTQDCYFMILSYPISRHSQKTANLLKQLASLYANSFQIAQINSTHPEYKNVCKMMNLPQNQVSLSYYISCFQPKKVRYYDQFDLESLTNFAGDMINQRIATLRSEDIPETQQQVIKLVGVTFNHFIANAETETVVLFYHHEELRSKFFFPRFEMLGEKLKRNKNITFATFNVATNQLVQNNQFEYLPSILFFHYQSVEPIFYQGPNQIKKLKKWIKQTTDFQWIEPEQDSEEDGIEEHRLKV